MAEKSTTKKFTTKQIVLTGLMAALVFVTNYIHFSIPLVAGSPTRIHIANGFCIIAGIALGPITGGLAAGIGSMFYDFTNPAYIASSPFTFLFKFLMAFVAGKIANKNGRNGNRLSYNILGAVCGQILYIVLYLAKKFIKGILVGNAVQTVITACLTSLFASTVNAIVAVILVAVLLPMFKKAIDKVSR